MASEPIYRPMYNEHALEYKYRVKVNGGTGYKIAKRIIDIILATAGLIIGIPLMIIFGIAIKLDSKGPIIYKQERLGENEKPFNLYKLRSMYEDAEKYGPKWADKNDDRVTKVGKLIRRTRIDEIPQLFNILQGDMSVVGPRPERPIFTYKFNEDIPGFIYRLKVKPGLTGLAQVVNGYDATPEKKLQLDIEYIQNMSIIMDLKIILKTIVVVFTGHGAR